MKHLCTTMSVLMLAAVLITPQLSYAGAQQNKMATCNKDANAQGLSGEGKGDARKAFMKECLSAKQEKGAAGSTQQNKMATCNKDAKAKKLAGDERKKFMKECLSN